MLTLDDFIYFAYTKTKKTKQLEENKNRGQIQMAGVNE